MVVAGQCLCGGIRFEIAEAVGPFELCHCRRCRKASGSAFVAGLGVRTADYRLLEGANLIERYEAPVVERAPGYRTAFCRRCGSPVPDPPQGSDWFEVPAGLLDAEPGVRPDRHIFVEHQPRWSRGVEGLPALTRDEVVAHRRAKEGR